MPEKKQRFICRTLFLIGCLLPTLFVCWSILFDSTKNDWSNALRDRLGVHAEIETIVTPQPGLTRLQNVSFTDYSNAHIVDLEQVFVTQLSNGKAQCFVPAIRIAAEDLPRLIERAEYALNHHPRLSCQIKFQKIEIYSKTTDQNLTFADCRLVVGKSATNQSITFDFHPQFESANGTDGDAKQKPCSFTMTRTEKEAVQESKYELQTNGYVLPTWAFADYVEPLQMLGDGATFQGTVLGGTDFTKIDGKFHQVDLFHYFSNSFAHELKGLADVQMELAWMQREGTSKIHGNVKMQSAPGSSLWIGTSLILSAERFLGMKSDSRPIASIAEVDRAELFISGNRDHIVLNGTCDTDGAIAIDSQGAVLLRSEHDQAIPVNAIIQALLLDGQQHLAMNRETRALLAWFPDESKSFR